MKHWKILIPALVLTLALTACGGGDTETQAPSTTAPASQAPTTEAPASQTPTTQAPVSGDATGSDLTADSGADRAAEGTLVYSVSGTEQQMAAELYDAVDYTLYLPKEGWSIAEEDGKPVSAVVMFAGEDGILVRLRLTQVTARALGLSDGSVHVYPSGK